MNEPQAASTHGAPPIAYFSMEIALNSHIPTYSGGLGVLAGDLLRSAADRGVRMLGLSLVHRHGYLFQRMDAQGLQTEEPVQWSPDDWLEPLDVRTIAVNASFFNTHRMLDEYVRLAYST
jgi:glucan phosphorylase